VKEKRKRMVLNGCEKLDMDWWLTVVFQSCKAPKTGGLFIFSLVWRLDAPGVDIVGLLRLLSMACTWPCSPCVFHLCMSVSFTSACLCPYLLGCF
jgi:hypothetical protein